MIDLKFLRDNPEKVREGAKQKGVHVDVEKILKLDEERRALLQKIETLRAKKNEAGKEIASSSAKASEDKKKKLLADMKKVDAEEEELKPQLQKIEKQLEDNLMQIPNLPLPDVKVGKDSTENEILRRVGEPTVFDFEPKDYLTLATQLDIIDVERAAKVSGTRFGYLKGDAALLEWALFQFAKDELLQEGFIPVIPPVLIKEQSMRGMGFLEHGGAEDVYHLKQDDLYLIGTSEQSVGPMHAGETFKEEELPRRYFASSTCFRREAGAHGKDTRGILRVHQFNKVEMFSYVKPEDGDKEHEYLVGLQERLMQALELPYHVVRLCTGDLGKQAARTIDIETWMPSENKYRETHSCSTCVDFQSRRLNIRYKPKDGGKPVFVHTLNGTAFSMNRPIIAIIENYQQKDGSMVVPKVLQQYMNKKKIAK